MLFVWMGGLLIGIALGYSWANERAPLSDVPRWISSAHPQERRRGD